MKETHKKIVGKGGIHCECCLPRGMSKKEARMKINRACRRKNKKELKNLN
jgi:hypothetical protein